MLGCICGLSSFAAAAWLFEWSLSGLALLFASVIARRVRCMYVCSPPAAAASLDLRSLPCGKTAFGSHRPRIARRNRGRLAATANRDIILTSGYCSLWLAGTARCCGGRAPPALCADLHAQDYPVSAAVRCKPGPGRAAATSTSESPRAPVPATITFPLRVELDRDVAVARHSANRDRRDRHDDDHGPHHVASKLWSSTQL